MLCGVHSIEHDSCKHHLAAATAAAAMTQRVQQLLQQPHTDNFHSIAPALAAAIYCKDGGALLFSTAQRQRKQQRQGCATFCSWQLCGTSLTGS
jgi:hypothetical protein